VNPWLAMLLIGGTLGGLIAGLRVFQRRASPHPEVVRKLLHVIMGLVTLSLPWLFDAAWPVLLLSAATLTLLIALRRPRLSGGVGQVISAVDRDSYGDLLFPLAVAVLFVLSGGDPLLFSIPMLILTLADAGAALVGLRYGLSHYGPPDERRSVEGSVAFFVTTFMSVLLTLLLATDATHTESILTALLMALLATLVEAVSWSGLDNLLIPLFGFLLLRTYLAMDWLALLTNLGVVLLLIAVVAAWRRRARLDMSAVVGAALAGYLIWSTGGVPWMLAPLILFLAYRRLQPPPEKGEPRRQQTVKSVASATLPGLMWLLLAETLAEPALIFPYTLSFATYLAIVGVARVRYLAPGTPERPVVVQSVVLGWLLLFVPFLLIEGVRATSLLLAGVAVLAIAAAAAIFYFVQPELKRRLDTAPLWLWQSAIAMVASGLGLVALLAV
jgi:phytol kinase